MVVGVRSRPAITLKKAINMADISSGESDDEEYVPEGII